MDEGTIKHQHTTQNELGQLRQQGEMMEFSYFLHDVVPEVDVFKLAVGLGEAFQ